MKHTFQHDGIKHAEREREREREKERERKRERERERRGRKNDKKDQASQIVNTNNQNEQAAGVNQKPGPRVRFFSISFKKRK